MTLLPRPLTALLILLSSSFSTQARAIEIGPHELTLSYTPMVQRAVRAGDTNANAELDIIGQFRLFEGRAGGLGETRLSFWALGNHTLGGTTSTGAFSRGAGLLWDSNDGDAPETDWLLGLFALQQDFSIGQHQASFQIGKLYPGNDLATLPYAGDDRDSFMSQIISSDTTGRWYDRIGLGASLSIKADNWFATALISDATAQSRGFDFDSLSDGSNLMAVEMGMHTRLGGRATKLSLTPYHIGSSTDFTTEKGLVVTFSHDLVNGFDDTPAPISLFGRYTFRTGGEPLTADGRADAKTSRRGGFLGVAFNRPFGQETQQIGVALMQGSASRTAQSQGFGSQYGVETYWKTNIGKHAEFTTDLQIINRGTRGTEFIPGLRLKVVF